MRLSLNRQLLKVLVLGSFSLQDEWNIECETITFELNMYLEIDKYIKHVFKNGVKCNYFFWRWNAPGNPVRALN